jgi:hypothetical protein
MRSFYSFCLIALISAWVGCAQPRIKIVPLGPTPSKDGYATVTEAKDFMKKAAKRARDKLSILTFGQFRSKVYQEPKELGGKYLVNGDTPILNEKQLEEFFETQVKLEPVTRPTELTSDLIIHQAGGQDAVWNSSMQHNLTYCVSKTFANRYAQVVSDMEAATRAWEQAADVNFIHIDVADDTCSDSNTNVVFDVRPVNVNGQYLARAFFPNEPRASRNVLIDQSSFELDPNGKLALVGILRHELGHTLGFRHEHTRPESGACFEDNDWRPLTNYDPLSVMHYPQCNGAGDWSLILTNLDNNGAACLYGSAPGFTVDPAICANPKPKPAPCNVKTEVISRQSVSTGQENRYGPFSVTPGTLFEVKMQGMGDPDLYVRFLAPPDRNNYDCRPYLSGADEACSLDVPSGQTKAHVMVRGYSPDTSTYSLTVVHSSASP